MLSYAARILVNEEQRGFVEDLYRQNEQLLYRAAYSVVHNREDAEDAVMTTFQRVADRFGRLRFDNSVRTRALLVTICRNAAIDIYNRNARITADPEPDLSQSGEDVEQNLLAALHTAELSRAIERLSQRSREVIFLRYVQELSTRDIGELYGITQSAVRKRLSAAYGELRALLGGDK